MTALVQVERDLISVRSLDLGGGVTWSNVTIPYLPTCPPRNNSFSGCVVGAFRSGGG